MTITPLAADHPTAVNRSRVIMPDPRQNQHDTGLGLPRFQILLKPASAFCLNSRFLLSLDQNESCGALVHSPMICRLSMPH